MPLSVRAEAEGRGWQLALTPVASLRALGSPADEEAVARMSLGLYAEDPGQRELVEGDVRRTLAHLARHPDRGRVVVISEGEEAVGYVILVAFWSNELGGLVAVVDELYLSPSVRGRGLGTGILEAIIGGRVPGFEEVVAVDLEVTPSNARARALYARLGFRPQKNTGLRRRVTPS